MQAALDQMVALKLEPERNSDDLGLFRHYRCNGYPTLLFLNAEGAELDRFGDFMPPHELLSAIERIRKGDTFFARLARLDENPANFEVLQLVHDGLMVREDFPQIYARIAAFQAANPDLHPDPSVPLLQETLMYQHSWLYGGAGRFYRNNWEDEIPEIGEPLAAPSLMALLENSLPGMPKTEQAERLRQARFDDAGVILELRSAGDLTPDQLFSNADFAFDNGHYDLAASLYTAWFDAVEEPSPGDLNHAAWSLFLCRRDLEPPGICGTHAVFICRPPSLVMSLSRSCTCARAAGRHCRVRPLAASRLPMRTGQT